MRNLTFLEQLSFRLTDVVGSPLSLFLHTAFIIGIFTLRFLGILDNLFLISTASVFSLEALFFVIFIQIKIKRHTKSLSEIESSIESMRDDQKEIHKLMIQILHLAHKIKLQKPSTNGHRPHRIQA